MNVGGIETSSLTRNNGRSGGIRTHDLFTPSKARYQAALRSDTWHSLYETAGEGAMTHLAGAHPHIDRTRSHISTGAPTTKGRHRALCVRVAAHDGVAVKSPAAPKRKRQNGLILQGKRVWLV